MEITKIHAIPAIHNLNTDTINSDNGSDFFTMLDNKFSDVVKNLRETEAIAHESTIRNDNIEKLVTKMAEAELNVKALSSITEKLVGAINEVVRMQV